MVEMRGTLVMPTCVQGSDGDAWLLYQPYVINHLDRRFTLWRGQLWSCVSGGGDDHLERMEWFRIGNWKLRARGETSHQQADNGRSSDDVGGCQTIGVGDDAVTPGALITMF